MGYFSRKSVSDHNVPPLTWSFKCKRRTDWKIRKFKAQYCVRGDVQKIMYPETLDLYYTVVQWATVSLILIPPPVWNIGENSYFFITLLYTNKG